MAFDAFYLKFTLDEIREKCLGGRVEKIFQPSRDSLIMLIKGSAGREKLLIVANPTAPRLHLTAVDYRAAYGRIAVLGKAAAAYRRRA